MVTLEQAAKAWAELGRVMYPSLAEVEATLTSREHPDAAHGPPEDTPTTEEH